MALDGVDGSSSSSVPNPCKGCGKIAKSGLKCVSCGTVTHAGCVKPLRNIKVIDDKSIECCVLSGSSDGCGGVVKLPVSVGPASTEAVNGFPEVYYLKQILDHKDVIIKNQAELIDSLRQQIQLMKLNVNSHIPTSSEGTMSDRRELPRSSYANVTARIDLEEKADKQTVFTRSKKNGRENTNQVSPKKDKKLANLQHLETATEAKFNEIIYLNSDSKESNITRSDGKTTTGGAARMTHSVRGGRQHKKPIIGAKVVKEDNASIRAATTFRSFHVSKLHPGTTVGELTAYLQPDFEGVRVEKLESRHPEVYSSFRIDVNEANAVRVLEPALWPVGCRVNKFFHTKKRTVN